MLYLYLTLLTVTLSTNKTDHHAICDNISGIAYNIVTSFIGVEHHFQQHVMYSMVTSIIGVEHHLQ
jgi:hypothetical protein